jgi:hypothetical protein
MTDEPKCTYVPDYKTKCQNCDQVPTVQVFINGKLDNHFEMCGPCTFGEAACIDPEEW